MDITIRLATPADAQTIARVLACAWSAAYAGIIPDDFIQRRNAVRPAQFRENITAENDSYYVVVAEGQIVGYLRAVDMPEDDALDVEQFYFHPDYWRQGFGRRAMAFAQDLAHRTGKAAMTVWVLEQNTPAIGFYQACGFAADGGRKTFDYGKPLDVICMRKDLSP